MTEAITDDPWTQWYTAYRLMRAERRAEMARVLDRQRAAKLMAGLLVGYMLAGGALASLAVRLVMAN
jgi:hypothetical protein